MEQQGKKYLIYAIGEILLIVIGVLIAFQVNNWDIRKKEERQAFELVRNLRYDLIQDTTNFGRLDSMYRLIYQNRSLVMQLRDFSSISGDSLMNLVLPMYRTVDFVAPTFGKMETMGLTQLAGFDDLFDEVNTYYTSIQNNYLNFIDWDAQSTLKEAQFWYYNPDFENYYHQIFIGEPLPAIQPEEERKQELIRLLRTPEVRNMLRTSAMRKQTTLEMIGETRDFATGLLVLIDSALVR